MKMQIELSPRHWWIERASISKRPDITCRAMVKFKSDDDKIEISKEELFESIEQASKWVIEQLSSKEES